MLAVLFYRILSMRTLYELNECEREKSFRKRFFLQPAIPKKFLEKESFENKLRDVKSMWFWWCAGLLRLGKLELDWANRNELTSIPS